MKKKDIDVLKHELVPEHVVMDDKEAERIMREYMVSKAQLPKIKESDSAAKQIGAKSGDIIKVIRKSQTADRFVSYRITIK